MIEIKRPAVGWRGVTLIGAMFMAGCASTATNLMGSGTGVTASDPTRLTQN